MEFQTQDLTFINSCVTGDKAWTWQRTTVKKKKKERTKKKRKKETQSWNQEFYLIVLLLPERGSYISSAFSPPDQGMMASTMMSKNRLGQHPELLLTIRVNNV